MRKRVWLPLAALAFLAIGGIVYARSIRAHALSQTSNATSPSTGDENPCPLSWLLNQCGLCR